MTKPFFCEEGRGPKFSPLDAIDALPPTAGITYGFVGAMREPMTGFRADGFAGLTRGVFSAGVGIVSRPLYGSLVSTSQVSPSRAT